VPALRTLHVRFSLAVEAPKYGGECPPSCRRLSTSDRRSARAGTEVAETS
jgi:hypothetical protein